MNKDKSAGEGGAGGSGGEESKHVQYLEKTNRELQTNYQDLQKQMAALQRDNAILQKKMTARGFVVVGRRMGRRRREGGLFGVYSGWADPRFADLWLQRAHQEPREHDEEGRGEAAEAVPDLPRRERASQEAGVGRGRGRERTSTLPYSHDHASAHHSTGRSARSSARSPSRAARPSRCECLGRGGLKGAEQDSPCWTPHPIHLRSPAIRGGSRDQGQSAFWNSQNSGTSPRGQGTPRQSASAAGAGGGIGWCFVHDISATLLFACSPSSFLSSSPLQLARASRWLGNVSGGGGWGWGADCVVHPSSTPPLPTSFILRSSDAQPTKEVKGNDPLAVEFV